jgi:NADPH-dependent 2,4-dienoyl-CoA reductase/sulfur reductase-like enzyme
MPERSYDVLVVGAGPAGLAAACRAAEAGLKVAVVDDNPWPGGQIWRPAAGRFQSGARAWLATAKRFKVELIAGATVFAAPAPGRLALESSSLGPFDVAYKKLVLATGARERFIPFPGWTLPNVMGAGGLQALAKGGLPVAGRKIVIAGSGPLLLAVAKYMNEHGADVRLIAEQAPRAALLRFGLSLAQHPEKLIQAIQIRGSLFSVRYLAGCWPVAAEGERRLASVTLRRGVRTWTEPCDYLACGFGLVPNLELPLLLGCRVSETGVWVDEFQSSSIAGVYGAGEVTGIGGLELALVEGEIAGLSAAGRLETARRRFAARQSGRRFAAALTRAFALRGEVKMLPQPDTLVCRCEDVPLGRIRGYRGWREAKLHTRCGMGPCQGRVCGPALEFLEGWKVESVRPPLFPARVGSLIKAAAETP